MIGCVLLESHLKKLKLPTFLREYKPTARQCGEADKSYEDYLLNLAELEVQEREHKSTDRRIKEAGFPAEKDLTHFDFSAVPKLNKRQILNLTQCEYIEKRENIVFVGSPGVGKTHLTIALGREACYRGYRVKFFTAAGLVTAYAEAQGERHVQRLEKHIQNRHLIIVDELGYVPLGKGAAENLFNFFSLCYERTSLIVTTNLPFSEWPVIFGDERLAGALIDRLTHCVHIVEIKGESYRLRASMQTHRKEVENV
jgi:DNA replication protein DnaC